MRGGYRIGRLLGIDLTVDYSWIFIFVLLTWNLTAVFTQWHPAWASAESFGIAVAASLLFFASVVLHELAHATVAKAYGIPVTRITLFLFGGVSNIEREPPSPDAEFLTALVGPVVSVILGALLLTFASLIAAPDVRDAPFAWEYAARIGPVSTLLLWLGPVNITVGLFNLIPGFPLDGGRLLRAALWRATGDLHRSTRWASWSGQAIGWMLVLLGVAMAFGARVPFFGAGMIGGLWLAFIGWFLTSAAAQSYEGLLVHEVLEGVTVARLMRPRGASVRADSSVESLVREGFMHSDDRAFLVLDDAGRFVGLVCRRDLRQASEPMWGETPVGQIMTPVERLVTTAPNEGLSSALAKLTRIDVGQLPVVEDGELVGLLERRDVSRWIEIRLGQSLSARAYP